MMETEVNHDSNEIVFQPRSNMTVKELKALLKKVGNKIDNYAVRVEIQTPDIHFNYTLNQFKVSTQGTLTLSYEKD